MRPPVIECHGVSRSFVLRSTRHRLLKDRVLSAVVARRRTVPETFWALSGVDFTVDPGESFALIGPNGAGKTTLFRLLAGIYQATSGRITVRGRLAPLLALGLGFHPELSGRENIYINAGLFGLTTRQIRKVEQTIAAFSELGDFIDAPTKTYSAGMQLRLGFSIAVNLDAEIYLVDEVFAVGDEHFSQKCLRRLEEERLRGRTFVVATHDLAFVRERCDRAALLMGGRITALGAAKDVVGTYLEAVGREGGTTPSGPARP
jgi:ABC-2 type transport system ATP-binding protein/lipopolysaccharide transport system ATP-binding protein